MHLATRPRRPLVVKNALRSVCSIVGIGRYESLVKTAKVCASGTYEKHDHQTNFLKFTPNAMGDSCLPAHSRPNWSIVIDD